MLKIYFNNWVKNVYRLFIYRCTSGVYMYTGSILEYLEPKQVLVKLISYTQSINNYPPIISTYKLLEITPTKTTLSTISTAPIITKTIKK